MIIIPCGGKQTRWNGDGLKHLAVLPDGETVLGRLLTQCVQAGCVPYVYGQNKVIPQMGGVYGCFGVHHDMQPTLTEFILTTQSEWEAPTIILLGDVVLSDAAFETIMDSIASPMFFGNQGEIFAFSFNAIDRERVITGLKIANTYAECNRRDGGGGKLWSLYKALTNWPQHKEVETLFSSLFTDINDWSTDIDTVEEYDALYTLLEAREHA